MNGEVVGGQELRGEKFAIAEVQRRLRIGREESIEIAEEDLIEDAKTFIIKEDEDDSILLCEATNLYR